MNENETGPKNKSQNVEEILRLLACSDLRNSLAKALRDGKKMTLSELSAEVGASSPAAVHALRGLVKESVTRQDEKRNYLLTNIGEIVTRKLEEVNVTIAALSKHKQFWLEHDLSGIPEDLLKNIRRLQASQVLTSTPTDVFNAFSTFTTLLKDAKVIRGVAPVFTPSLLDIYAELAAKGIQIELVVTQEVLENMLELANRSPLKDQLKTNLKLFVIKQNPKTAFTVTDYFFIFGLFRFDGSYDYSDELLSYSKDGIKWGSELFDHFVRASKEFDLKR